MKGTEKQIAWAQDIIETANIRLEEAWTYWAGKREKEIKVEEIRKAKGLKDRSEKHAADFEKLRSGYENLKKELASMDDAHEIIEKRNDLIVKEDDRNDLLKWADGVEAVWTQFGMIYR